MRCCSSTRSPTARSAKGSRPRSAATAACRRRRSTTRRGRSAAQELERHYGFEPTWRDFDGFLRGARAVATGGELLLLGRPGHDPQRDRRDRACPDGCRREPSRADARAPGVRTGRDRHLFGSHLSAREIRRHARADRARQAAAASGSPLYASHIRSEGDGLIEAVDEALTVGRASGVAVQLSHHKASQRRNWGKVHDTLSARRPGASWGCDVVLDQYPYKASSTGLDVILPSDVNVGTRESVASSAERPALCGARGGARRTRIRRALARGAHRLGGFEQEPPLRGAYHRGYRAIHGPTPVAAALRLLVEERLDVSAIYFTMCEDDVRAVLSYARHVHRHRCHRALPTQGPTSSGKPHPRSFGTFPRIFKRYVRDTRLLSLPEAVRRATALPAGRLGLRGRGTVAMGNFADVVVFDRELIADTATYMQPHCYPLGIAHVFVNGAAAVRDGVTTGQRHGRVLRRGRDL